MMQKRIKCRLERRSLFIPKSFHKMAKWFSLNYKMLVQYIFRRKLFYDESGVERQKFSWLNPRHSWKIDHFELFYLLNHKSSHDSQSSAPDAKHISTAILLLVFCFVFGTIAELSYLLCEFVCFDLCISDITEWF